MRARLVAAVSGLLFLCGAVACVSDPGVAPEDAAVAPLTARTTVALRRLTESQYRHSIADVFGPDLKLEARFEPERREGGLLAIGNASLSITTSGLEQYYALAQSISDQVLVGERRDEVVGCGKPSVRAEQDACVRAFISAKGEQLFRRPLTEAETAARMAVWSNAIGQTGDFDGSLKLVLTSLLVAPDFLFRVERAEAAPGGMRLDGYTRAERLSFLLWDQAPDAELMAAAERGDLFTEAGLRAQIDRMTASPKLEQGVRAFFADMLQFDAFENMAKDPATYPKFSQAVADSSREETLRFLVDHLVTQNADYRDIFTSRKTILNRPLSAVYQVPFPSKEAWADYTFSEESGRSGILTQAAFLSLFSHPAASSPTRRGIKVNEIFQCVPTADPPPDVDFSKVQALDHGTVRVRLIAHMTNPGCSSCHKVSDPPGLALEHFDGLGQLRKYENGELIDVSAEMGPKTFTGAAGLGEYLRESPLVPSCLTRNVYTYGTGRAFDYSEMDYLNRQTGAFAAGGYRMRDLYRAIATSPEFFKVVLPEGAGQTPAARDVVGVGDDVSTGEGG